MKIVLQEIGGVHYRETPPVCEKPALIFPYHDPQKKFNNLLVKNIELLREEFSEIFVSATQPTLTENGEIVEFLEKSGCFVFKNEEDAKIGDHFRNALSVYLEKGEQDRAYFGFIDRILFDLETQYKKDFVDDVQLGYQEDLVIFSRSKKAWNTHPRDYYSIEKILNDAGKILFDKDFDWVWCGILLNKRVAEVILKESKSNDFSIMPEFILISMFNNIDLRNKSVDWQAWEAPFWSQINQEKVSEELSQKEKLFRLSYVNSAINVFLEKVGQ